MAEYEARISIKDNTNIGVISVNQALLSALGESGFFAGAVIRIEVEKVEES